MTCNGILKMMHCGCNSRNSSVMFFIIVISLITAVVVVASLSILLYRDNLYGVREERFRRSKRIDDGRRDGDESFVFDFDVREGEDREEQHLLENIKQMFERWKEMMGFENKREDDKLQLQLSEETNV